MIGKRTKLVPEGPSCQITGRLTIQKLCLLDQFGLRCGNSSPKLDKGEIMQKKTTRRLLLKFLVLILFSGGFFLLEPETNVQAFVSCSSCTASYQTRLTQCDTDRDTCYSNCDSNFYPYLDAATCKSNRCDPAWSACRWSAGLTETDCYLTCTPGSGGGGTGGGLTKTPCVNACYAQRVACFGNQGIPDAEDCVNEGTHYAVCCYEQFQGCLEGC